MILTVTIPGPPVAKGRPKFARRGKFVTTYTPDATVAWEDKAIVAFRGAYKGPPLDVAVRLEVLAIAGRTKGMIPKPGGTLSSRALAADPGLLGRQWRLTKPDGDNVLKCVGDALVSAGVVRDDTVIVRWQVDSLTAARDEGPCVVVRLVRVDPRP